MVGEEVVQCFKLDLQFIQELMLSKQEGKIFGVFKGVSEELGQTESTIQALLKVYTLNYKNNFQSLQRIIIYFVMTTNTTYSLQKKRYTQISVKKRMTLVRLVVDQGKTLSEAGRKLHINPSTVRLIIKKYKETGTYFMKKLRNTPKQEGRSCQQPRNEENNSKSSDQQSESKSQQKQKEGVVVKQEGEVKIEEVKPNDLRWYYPFLQYGYQY